MINQPLLLQGAATHNDMLGVNRGDESSAVSEKPSISADLIS